jgi:prepilin-type N-terminal cleavage/methylation domain-containing protein
MARRLHKERRVRIKSAERGFTLVEMMVVVAIVMILSMIAIVGYRRLIASSHTNEALEMVHSIRVAQESYHAEVQQYLNVSNDLNSTYPAASPGRFVTAWGASCGNCTYPTAWQDLPVHVDGPTMFGYATIAGIAGASSPKPANFTVNGQTVTVPSSSAIDWFEIAAHGSPDGATSVNVYGTSFNNDVFVDGD